MMNMVGRASSMSPRTTAARAVRLDAVCFVYTCRRLIDLSLIAGLFTGVWNTSMELTIYGYTAMNCSAMGAPYNCPKDCSQAVEAAITTAGAAGGGIVTLGTGRWYLEGPLLLPHNVILRGAGMDKTAIYFGFRNASTSPPTMIGARNTTAPGVRCVSFI